MPKNTQGDDQAAAPDAEHALTSDVPAAEQEPEPTATEDVSPVAAPPTDKPTGDSGKRWQQWIRHHKKVGIAATVIAVILVLGLIPFTRFALAGTVLKNQFKVQVVDAETNRPVSNAQVTLAGTKVLTDSKGYASTTVPVGAKTVAISKEYFKAASLSVTVPILKQKTIPTVKLQATGRQIPISLSNVITKKPLANVMITAGAATAKTDKTGRATLVVAATEKSVEATFSLKGYNDVKQTLTVGSLKVAAYSLTPAGKVYFLSNQSGKIDVVKANLDGSERQVVIAGTGKEDRDGTSLLASRDWKYLAFHARRDSDKAKLYLIDTATDKLTVMDEGNASFTVSGWSGHHFVYTVTRDTLKFNEPKYQALKSFNAPTQKLTTLTETTAEVDAGTGSGVYEALNGVYILDNEIVYVKNWNSIWNYYYNYNLLNGKQATLTSVQPDGKGKKVIKGYDRKDDKSTHIDISARSYGAQELYIIRQDIEPGTVEEYEGGHIKKVTDISVSDAWQKPYPTYLISPSGEKSFWTDYRDGKQAFFIGSKEGEGEKQIATLGDFNAYGWYGDEYLLLAKNGSELYVAPVGAIKDESALVRVGSYYRAQIYNGYGYGYGGL